MEKRNTIIIIATILLIVIIGFISYNAYYSNKAEKIHYNTYKCMGNCPLIQIEGISVIDPTCSTTCAEEMLSLPKRLIEKFSSETEIKLEECNSLLSDSGHEALKSCFQRNFP